MKRNGFTLIELLLAVSIFAIIGITVYSVFASSIKLSAYSEGQGDVYRQARWILDLMSRELESAVYYDFSNSYEELAAFSGTKEEIRFLLRTDDGLKSVKYYLILPESSQIHQVVIGKKYKKNVDVSLESEEAQRDYYLVREEKAFVEFLNNTASDKDKLEVLATNIKADGLAFQFGYIDTPDAEETSWRGQWDSKFVPLNVKIAIQFKTGRLDETIDFQKKVLIPTGFWGEPEQI